MEFAGPISVQRVKGVALCEDVPECFCFLLECVVWQLLHAVQGLLCRLGGIAGFWQLISEHIQDLSLAFSFLSLSSASQRLVARDGIESTLLQEAHWTGLRLEGGE